VTFDCRRLLHRSWEVNGRRFATIPSVPPIGQTLPDIGAAVAHIEAISDRSLARTGLTDLLQLRHVGELIWQRRAIRAVCDGA
jgi:hypothetical protein